LAVVFMANLARGPHARLAGVRRRSRAPVGLRSGHGGTCGQLSLRSPRAEIRLQNQCGPL